MRRDENVGLYKAMNNTGNGNYTDKYARFFMICISLKMWLFKLK